MKISCGMKMHTFLSVVNKHTENIKSWIAHQHAATHTLRSVFKLTYFKNPYSKMVTVFNCSYDGYITLMKLIIKYY